MSYMARRHSEDMPQKVEVKIFKLMPQQERKVCIGVFHEFLEVDRILQRSEELINKKYPNEDKEKFKLEITAPGEE